MTVDVHYHQETLCRIPERHVPALRALCESAGIATTYSPTKRTLLLRKWLEGRHLLLVREPGTAGAEPLARFCDQLIAHLEGVDADVDLAFALPPVRAPGYDLVLSVAAGSRPSIRCTYAPRNQNAQNAAARIAAQLEQASGLDTVVTAERWRPFRLRNRTRQALPDGVPAVFLEIPLYEGSQADAASARLALAVYQGILASFGARAPLLAPMEPEVWEPFIRHVVPRLFPHQGNADTLEARPAAQPEPAAALTTTAADTGSEHGKANEPTAAPEAEEGAGDEPALSAEHLLVRANVARAPAESLPPFFPAVIQQGLRQIKQTPDNAPQDAAATLSPQPDRSLQPPDATVTLFPPPIRRRIGEVLHEPPPTTPPVRPSTPDAAQSPSASGGCQTCGKVTWKPRRTHE